MDVAARLDGIRRRLLDDRADAAVVSVNANLRYLTAFDGVIDPGINAVCVITADEARFHTDSRYADAAIAAAAGGPWEIVRHKENLYIELCDGLRAEGVSTLLLEAGVPYGRFKFVSEQFDGAVRAVDQLVEGMRQIKEAEEVGRIAAAAALADAAFEHILRYLRPGVTERDVALELELHMRRNGSEGMPFDPIVAGGPNSARPHAIPSERPLEAGDIVILDFGAKIGGYCSDMTRTVVIGAASAQQRAMHAAVLEANEAGLAAVRAGRPCVEVDLAAREVLQRHGLGDHFTHGLGHGVGIDIHEMPTVGPRSTQSLRHDSVITIEPGVYVSGVAGVRIEDLVLVKESGHELLSHASKELIEL